MSKTQFRNTRVREGNALKRDDVSPRAQASIGSRETKFSQRLEYLRSRHKKESILPKI